MDNASAALSEPRICPFLRAAHDGRLADPLAWPDPANACIALGDVAPQSLRQQEYACLASAHVNCPRFVRGVHRMVEAAPAPVEAGLRLTPAILGALLVLAASFALSVGFVVANGGMDLVSPPSASPEAAIASAAPAPSGSSSPAVTEPSAASAPPASAPPSVEPTPEASVDSATAAPSLAPTPATTLTPSATPVASSDRYALLEPCGDEPDCWIYTVREGDNLVSIARYFGVPFDVVVERNPWTETTPLVAGQELRLPPPTR
jgi:hypothetical protein